MRACVYNVFNWDNVDYCYADVVVGGGVYGQQKRQLDSQMQPTMNYDKETQLPQEWTY